MTHILEICRQCGEVMEPVSPENTSPLVMRCQVCGHEEYREVQIAPPWPARPDCPRGDWQNAEPSRKKKALRKSLRPPISIDPLAKETVLPVGWILLWTMLVGFVLLVLVLL